MDFENKLVNGIHATRYVASYVNAGGKITGLPRYDSDFIHWLKQLVVNGRKLTDEEISEIYAVAQMLKNGKLELESNARAWIKEGTA